MGLSPSRTGLIAQTLWRSPGSRAHCVLTCLDSSTTPSPAATREINAARRCCLPTDRKGSALGCMFSELNDPARQRSCLRFATIPRGSQARLEARMESLLLFRRLFIPYQCAGLSRRSPSPGFPRFSIRFCRSGGTFLNTYCILALLLRLQMKVAKYIFKVRLKVVENADAFVIGLAMKANARVFIRLAQAG